MKNLINIIAAPSKVFAEIRQKPKWIVAFCSSVCAYFFLTWLGGCWQDLSDAFYWPNLLAPAVISPIIVGGFFLGATAFICLVMLIVGGGSTHSTRFAKIFSVVSHCGIILLLGEIVNFILVRSNLLGDYHSPIPNRFPLGLDLLVKSINNAGLYVSIILHGINFFSVWCLFVLAMGINTVTGSTRWRSGWIAISLWAAGIGMALFVAYVLDGETVLRIRL
jgi:hypothetical protein